MHRDGVITLEIHVHTVYGVNAVMFLFTKAIVWWLILTAFMLILKQLH